VRNRRESYFHTSHANRFRILSTGCGHAGACVIDAIDLTGWGKRSEFLDGSAPAATHVQDREVRFDVNMRESPVGQARMGDIHDPKKESANTCIGLSDLIHDVEHHDS
jgi:hypothetical protein